MGFYKQLVHVVELVNYQLKNFIDSSCKRITMTVHAVEILHVKGH